MPSPRQNTSAPARRTSPGGTISDVKLGHIVAALGRYRPVLAVVATIVLLALVLEGPTVVGGTDPYAASNEANAVRSGASPTTTTTAPDAGQDNFTAPSPLGGAGDNRRTPAAASPAASPGDGGSSFSYTPPAASTSGGGGSTGSGSFDSGGDPLTISAAAWASRAGGTPLGGTGVPDDSLPVGTRLGQDDKRSFVRLEGDEGILTLVPIDEEDGQRNAEEAAIRMCQVTEGGWEEDEAMPFSDAPPYDEEECIDGILNEDDGSWTFSLLVFSNPTDNRGFALVPGEDAPIDFQVAFART